MNLEEKSNKCSFLASKLIDTVEEIDPKLKVLVIIEDGETSIVQSSNPKDLTEAIGLLRVTEARLYVKEQEMFKRRTEVTDAINRILKETGNLEINDKGKLN